MYDDFLRDKNLVDPAWWDFFEDYRPGAIEGQTSAATSSNTSNTSNTPPSRQDEKSAATPEKSAASGQNTASPNEAKTQTPASQNGSTSQASGHDQANR